MNWRLQSAHGSYSKRQKGFFKIFLGTFKIKFILIGLTSMHLNKKMILFDKKPVKLVSCSKGPKSAVLRVQKVPRGLLGWFKAPI